MRNPAKLAHGCQKENYTIFRDKFYPSYDDMHYTTKS